MQTAIFQETLGAGENVVMIHGWGMHSGVWRPFAQTLSQHYCVTLLDLPGHGDSEAGADLSLAGIAQALLVSAPERAHWVGWSLGATLALYIARHHPQRVLSVTLVAGNARFTQAGHWPHGMEEAVFAKFTEGLIKDYHATILRFLGLQTWGLPDARQVLQQLREVLSMRGEPDRRALMAGLEILRDADLLSDLPYLEAPLLIVLGGRDRLVPPAAGKAMGALAADAEQELIAGAGHIPFITHAEQCREHLLAFWRRNASRSSDNHHYKRRVSRSFGQAAQIYDGVATLQRRVGDGLLQRLEALKLQPGSVLDLGSGTGYCTSRLIQYFPSARIIALDIAREMLAVACTRIAATQYLPICGDAEALPFAEGSLDLTVSNLALQWCPDPATAFAQLARASGSGGYLVFSTLGSATLAELKQAWLQVDDKPHVNTFLSTAEWEALLSAAGFEVIALHNELISLFYADVYDLMRELKMLGARNQAEERPRHLTGRQAMSRMIAAYQAAMPDQRIRAGFDVIQIVARKTL
jgi:pimeloyl-ACP methyl ester esterase/malonyl-ACP O-methyltransferase BioC